MAGMFHYHLASTCRGDESYAEKWGQKDQEVLALVETAYRNLRYRSVYGISKDGRPIYTPYHGNGQTYGDCDVDVCNGLEIGGHYAYVSTLFHPYFLGCYGRGSSPSGIS